MIPNRVFAGLFGLALVALAVVNLTQSPLHWSAVVLPAFAGLWLVNIATRRGHARAFCGAGRKNHADAG